MGTVTDLGLFLRRVQVKAPGMDEFFMSEGMERRELRINSH